MGWKDILKEEKEPMAQLVTSGDRLGDNENAIRQKMNEFGYEEVYGKDFHFKPTTGTFSNLGDEHNLVLQRTSNGVKYISPQHNNSTYEITNPNKIRAENVEQLLTNHRVYLKSR
tara:strand:+ start:506 stop:850 length:345 start_codon:yes stop_codon:yes gene_type:complete